MCPVFSINNCGKEFTNRCISRGPVIIPTFNHNLKLPIQELTTYDRPTSHIAALNSRQSYIIDRGTLNCAIIKSNGLRKINHNGASARRGPPRRPLSSTLLLHF